MRSLSLLAALMGAVSAAPYQAYPVNAVAHKRNANSFTKATPGKEPIINEKNMLVGKYHTDKTVTRKGGTKAGDSLTLDLVNNFGGENLNAYFQAQDPDGKIFFIDTDGNMIYPSSGGSAEPVPVEDPITLKLPGQGETFTVTIPSKFDSGRIYFVDGEMPFSIVHKDDGNEGVVQPDPTAPDDPSSALNWGFVELTLNEDGELWANLSFVDFVGLILSMTINEEDGSTQDVVGLPGDGVGTVCDELKSQGDNDGRPWGSLCVADDDGNPLRVVAPVHFEAVGGGMDDYFDPYVNDAWSAFGTNVSLTINTPEDGDIPCHLEGEELSCDGSDHTYMKPTIEDIWGCNSGPFATEPASDSKQHLIIVPILCAAVQRGTLLLPGGDQQPSGVEADAYYSTDIVNHYGRIIHENEIDGRGYTFPYDEISPDGTENAAGLLRSSTFEKLTFYVGGAPQ